MKDLVFLVAEIGVNWDGDTELVSNMIKSAKFSGFDAVKFQAYNESVIGEHPEKNRLLKSAISKDNIESINGIARKVGIEWFCTPMYPEAVDLLEPYVNRFKIRVTDGKPLLENNTSKLIDKIFKTNKKVIVSSQISPKNSKFENHSSISWLYCVPIYPCRLDQVDFTNLKDFNGYSNHCVNIAAPLTAAILGAQIVEVHVTSDKTKDFFDNPVSFDFDEASRLIELINSSEQINK